MEFLKFFEAMRTVRLPIIYEIPLHGRELERVLKTRLQQKAQLLLIPVGVTAGIDAMLHSVTWRFNLFHRQVACFEEG
jgi:hypothetical protein